MKELLNELLSHILVEANATRNNKYGVPNGLFHHGKGRYYDSETGGQYKGSVIDKKWYPAGKEPKITKTLAQREKDAAKEKAIKSKQIVKVEKPDRYMGKKTDKSPSDPAKAIRDLKRLTGASKQGKDLVAAIEAGDKKTIKKLVKELGLTIEGGKIRGKSIEGNSDAKKLFGDNKNAPVYVNTVLESLGLPLLPIEGVRKEPSETSSETSASDAEVFKPSIVFSDRPEVPVSMTANSVTIGKAVYKIFPTYSEGSQERISLVEHRNTNEQLQIRHPDVPRPELERRAAEISGIVDTHNTRVRFLQAEIQRGGTFTDLGSGPEAIDLISERLRVTLEQKIPEQFRDELASELDRFRDVTTVEDFDALWVEFNETLTKSNLPDGSIPLICEHLTAIRNAMLGASIMFPKSDTFKLGDIIAYREGPSTVKSIIDSVQLIEVSLDVGSVKRKEGAASVVDSRTRTSTFTRTDVEEALQFLGRSPSAKDPGIMGDIYNPDTPEKLAKVEEKIVGIIKTHMKDVRGFYRIPDSISDDEIIAGLKHGTPPVYDRKTGEFVKFGEDSKTFSLQSPPPDKQPISELNASQLRLYSLVGFTYDAIYNVNCTGQAFSNTSFKSDKILVSDGLRVMSQSRFQFNKKMSWRKIKAKKGKRGEPDTPERIVLRDDGVAGALLPVPRSKMGIFRGN